jgi:hypothetical protein
MRGFRRRTLHGRKTRHGAAWALAVDATGGLDVLDIRLYLGCEASSPLMVA